jgi:hypothetical protein
VRVDRFAVAREFERFAVAPVFDRFLIACEFIFAIEIFSTLTYSGPCSAFARRSRPSEIC